MTELGNRLKEARLAKNMSLDDLQFATKIQKRYLIGIEEGNYSMMPGKFYVRAFIKQYAEAVGINPEELFEEFKNEIPLPASDDIPEQLSRVQTRKNISGGNSKIFEVLPKILIGVFIIGAVAVVYSLLQNNEDKSVDMPADQRSNQTVKVEEAQNFTENSKEKDNSAKDKEQAKTERPKEEAEPKKASKQEITVAQTNGRSTVYELKNAEKFNLKVSSSGETWVNILNGKGHSFGQATLKKGEEKKLDFSKEEEAVIIVGNLPQTEIYVNEEKISFVHPDRTGRQEITIRYLQNNE